MAWMLKSADAKLVDKKQPCYFTAFIQGSGTIVDLLCGIVSWLPNRFHTCFNVYIVQLNFISIILVWMYEK